MRYKKPLEAEFGSNFCKDSLSNNIQNEPPMTEEQWEDSHDAWYQDHHIKICDIRDRVDRMDDLLKVCVNGLTRYECREDPEIIGMVLFNFFMPEMKLLKQELREYGDKSRDS